MTIAKHYTKFVRKYFWALDQSWRDAYHRLDLNHMPMPRNQEIPWRRIGFAVPNFLTGPGLLPPPTPQRLYVPLTQQQHADLRHELDDAQTAANNLRGERDTAKATADDLQGQLATSQVAESATQGELDRLQASADQIKLKRYAFDGPAEAEADVVPEIRRCSDSISKGSDWYAHLKACDLDSANFNASSERWKCPGSTRNTTNPLWVPHRFLGVGSYGCAVLWLKHSIFGSNNPIDVSFAAPNLLSRLTHLHSESLQKTSISTTIGIGDGSGPMMIELFH